MLVNKAGVLEPPKVFASMRFPDGKPLPEAFELKERLANLGINLLIVRVAAGDSIHESVFRTSMAKCVGFVAMGSIGYGEDTGNKSCTHYEVLEWNKTYAPVWGPIMPVRLIREDDEFAFETAKKVFTGDALQLWWNWLGADKVAGEIAHAVSERVRD